MKLLVSIVNLKEAISALNGGCDIIDIKNPAEGSLGAQHPIIIKDIVNFINGEVEISATLGDLVYQPGTASLAALGLATLNIDYIKAGLYGVKTEGEALHMAESIVKAVRTINNKVKVIICGYGDFKQLGSINPEFLPQIAYESGSDGILIDLKTKDSSKIFDYLEINKISEIVNRAHDYNLSVALAGGITMDDIKLVKKLDVDIIGVRRGVSNISNWTECRISEDRVREFYRLIKTLR